MAEPDTYGDNRTLAERFAELNAAIKPTLTNQHADLLSREQDLVDECATGIPDAIADDEAEKSATDLGARINTFLSLVEGQRKNAKDEPAKSPKLIDEFFRTLSGPLSVRLETLRSRVNVYKNQKRIAEQRRKDEEAAKAREAERELARAREEAARKGRERLEAEARARDETDPDARREAQEAADAAERDRRAAEEEARRKAQEAADAQAAADAKARMVKAESGAQSGQVGTWRGRIVDPSSLLLSLGPLGPHFTQDHLQKAIDKAARTTKGTLSIPGVDFFEDFTTTFRGG